MINVGLIGSEYVVDKLLQAGKEYRELNFITRTFENENETEKALRDILHKIDIVVLSGPVPYFYVKDLIKERNLPYFFVQYDELAVLSGLLYLSLHTNKENKNFSIDLPHREHAEGVFLEFGLPSKNIYVIDYEETFDVEEIVGFHVNLYREGRINYVITSRINVYNRLVDHSIPVYRMIPPLKSFRDIINLVSLKGETLLLNSARFAVILVGENLKKQNWLTPKYEETNFKIYQILKSYAPILGASIIQKNGIISMYMDRRKLEDFTESFSHFPFYTKLKSKIQVEIAVGIGLGWSSQDAEKHAMIALNEANYHNGDQIYLVNQDMGVEGPLSLDKKYILKTDDEELLNIVKKTNLSVKTISKIKYFLEMTDKDSINSIDLSEALEISRRSAQRILKRLLDLKLASIVGEEQPHHKGRPIPLYRIFL